MKNTTAVIFPNTVPDEQLLTPLLLVFEPVVYCQPVENDDSGELLSQFCQTIVDSSLCIFHIPAPLKEHRDRFLKLVTDLRVRRDDYAAQLAHVSLAAISSGNRTRTETKSSILGALLAEHGIEGETQGMIEKLLWQARLMMKLAEQYDVEQKKMNVNIHNIEQKEKKLFSGMIKEDGNPFAFTGKLASLSPDGERMQHLRLKAWARLFAFGSSPFPGNIFISPVTDAVDRLCEEYEKTAGVLPEKIAVLPLPADPGKEGYEEQLLSFKENENVLLDTVKGAVVNLSPVSYELVSDWDTALQSFFPASKYGRCQLILYRFAGIHVKKLFLDSFGHDENELEEVLAEDKSGNVAIGLLSWQTH